MTQAIVDIDPFDAVEAPPPILMDRSTMERYATCPYQGWAVETRLVTSGGPEADAGTEAHEAISYGLAGYVESGEFDLEGVKASLLMARPDVQPQAIQGCIRSLWAIRQYLGNHNPADVLAFDGGTKGRSGQISRVLLPATNARGPVIATCELDLLLATPAPTHITGLDWKTGRTSYSVTSVAESFQFNFHNYVVREQFPAVLTFGSVVWDTRSNWITPEVVFTAQDAQEFEGRLLTAFQARVEAMASNEAGNPPATWPAHDKCRICPAVRVCPRVDKNVFRLNDDPAGYAREVELLELSLDARLDDLKAYVKQHGAIDLGAGRSFGVKPPSGRQTFAFIEPKKKDEE